MPSRGSITYCVAKELAHILWPLIEGSPIILEKPSTSWNRPSPSNYNRGNAYPPMKPLFTLVSVNPALNIIHGKLEQDPLLSSGTSLSIHNIVTLLENCLKSTYFTFQGKYYEQVQGSAMGCPISPLVANLFMEDFEARAISTTPNPQDLA